jgi:diaminohydroxyphosphoribosylaminopyrimidine deaminase / 5-amino-6-(5-phosphoribosylamino)uracil reductase
MSILSPDHYMSLALALAERGRYTVSPNPMVGCVIVKDNRVIGQGFHHHAGGPHAEILALEQAGLEARGASAYVTLEPCCHHGKTPPCTEALIKAGIKQVYAACIDPNPLVAGKGIEALRAAKINVNVGLGEIEAKRLNEIFFHFMKHKRPFVIAKWAMSLDGKTITHKDDTRDISSSISLQTAHRVRQQVDAILIGANTAKEDNPLLTVRWRALDVPITKQPRRIVLSSHGDLPLDLHLFSSADADKTIVVTTASVNTTWRQAALEKNITLILVEKNKKGRVDLCSMLNELGKHNITSVLVEGGRTVHENFMEENLVNQFHVYLAPVIIGSLPKKQRLSTIKLTSLATDFYFTADHEGETHV